MALSDEQWEMARLLFESGLSLSEISKRTGIKNKSSISRAAKDKGWKRSDKKQHLINEEVELNQQLREIETKKATLVSEKATLL